MKASRRSWAYAAANAARPTQRRRATPGCRARCKQPLPLAQRRIALQRAAPKPRNPAGHCLPYNQPARARVVQPPRHGAPASTPAVTASTGAARNACERHHRCTIPPHTPDTSASPKTKPKRYRRPYAPAVAAASAASSSSAGTKPQAPSCGQPQSSKRCWHGCRVRRPHDLQRARWQKGGTVRHQGFARGHPPHY